MSSISGNSNYSSFSENSMSDSDLDSVIEGFYYYRSGPYEYESEVSEESEGVTFALLEDLKNLMANLSVNMKVMTFSDQRDLSNKFFINIRVHGFICGLQIGSGK